MQEDRQPNERRIQRKGDHRVPKVRSSANSKRSHKSRVPRLSQSPRLRKTDKSQRKKPTSRRGSKFRGSNPAQGQSATSRRLTPDSIPKVSLPSNNSGSGPSRTTSLAGGTLPPPRLNADTQKNPFNPQQLASRGQRLDVQKPAERRPHHPGFAGTDIPFHENWHSGRQLLGMPPETSLPVHQEINIQPLTKPFKCKAPELRPVPNTLPQAAHRESLKQDPDIIDLTLDSSDDEFFDMPVKEPPLAKVPANRHSIWANSTTPAPPSPEKMTGDSFVHGFSTGPTILGSSLSLVKRPWDKPRMFVRYTLDLVPCLANISAHGFVDQIYMVPRWESVTIRSPEDPASEFVNNLCVLNAYGSALLVLAHGRENNPVTIHRLDYQSSTLQIGSYDRPAVPGKPNGLTAICSMMQPLSFATGGADHAIHIWNIDHDLKATCSESPLAIRHSSRIYSLLPIRDSSHKLVSSGADCNVNVYDLTSERVVNTIKLSNPGFHVHHSGNPSTLLIQTAHRERQFEIRDLRGRSITGAQVETFGFVSNGLRLSRFTRGDVGHSTLFACGDPGGRVHIWDLRNVKQPATQIKCSQTEINNVTWHESHILASSSDNRIFAIPYTYTN